MFKKNKVYVYIFKGNKVMLVNLENDSVIKSLIKLGLPSMIAQVVNMLYNLIDRIFVSNIGTQALSTLSVCFFYLHLALFFKCLRP